MTAFSLESDNKTWQRVKIALMGANPGIQRMFKELKSHLSQTSQKHQLQFLPFTDAQIIAAGGAQLGTGALSLYALYVIKNGTAGTGTATASVIKIVDDATDDTTAANQRAALSLRAANDQRIYMDPQGLALANGLVVNADTTLLGTTDSTAGDAGNGFALVG